MDQMDGETERFLKYLLLIKWLKETSGTILVSILSSLLNVVLDIFKIYLFKTTREFCCLLNVRSFGTEKRVRKIF